MPATWSTYLQQAHQVRWQRAATPPAWLDWDCDLSLDPEALNLLVEYVRGGGLADSDACRQEPNLDGEAPEASLDDGGGEEPDNAASAGLNLEPSEPIGGQRLRHGLPSGELPRIVIQQTYQVTLGLGPQRYGPAKSWAETDIIDDTWLHLLGAPSKVGTAPRIPPLNGLTKMLVERSPVGAFVECVRQEIYTYVLTRDGQLTTAQLKKIRKYIRECGWQLEDKRFLRPAEGGFADPHFHRHWRRRWAASDGVRSRGHHPAGSETA